MHPFSKGRSLQRDRRATQVIGIQLAFVMGSETPRSTFLVTWPGALMITNCYLKYSPSRQD